ncbi:hypothetical protein FACS1894198_5210 [Clostridia bacterium]|nr:hypothetical protein FACS1894198_5210 [Clostridia bacterium]
MMDSVRFLEVSAMELFAINGGTPPPPPPKPGTKEFQAAANRVKKFNGDATKAELQKKADDKKKQIEKLKAEKKK